LWHFWAASLFNYLWCSGGSVANALVTDLIPRESLSRGLALYNATTWLGGIAGCMLTGYAAQSVGTQPTLLAGACLPLIAIGLLAASGLCRRPAKAPSRADKTSPVELQPAVL
jgi:MFS family permease